MSFVERFVILCPYFGESTIGGFTVPSLMAHYAYTAPMANTAVTRSASCTVQESGLVYSRLPFCMLTLMTTMYTI